MTGLEIGTAIVSYIEPSPGYEREFNEWYERDHFPSTVLAGPGVFGGARFVATAACKRARPANGTLFGDPARGSYLSVAWVARGHQAEWDAWVVEEMKTITAQGRLFAQREHVHTAVYDVVQMAGTTAPVVAFARGYGGVVALAGTSDVPLPATSLVAEFALARPIVSSAEPPAHRLVLAFVDTDPIAALEALELPSSIGFASPFLATKPGTDTYTQELHPQ